MLANPLVSSDTHLLWCMAAWQELKNYPNNRNSFHQSFGLIAAQYVYSYMSINLLLIYSIIIYINDIHLKTFPFESMADSIFPTFEQAATLWLMETNYDLVSTAPSDLFAIICTIHMLLNLFQ